MAWGVASGSAEESVGEKVTSAAARASVYRHPSGATRCAASALRDGAALAEVKSCRLPVLWKASPSAVAGHALSRQPRDDTRYASRGARSLMMMEKNAHLMAKL